jgi:hypothetical protein
MKRRIIQGITLTTAWRILWLAQNSPAEIKMSVPFAGGLGTSQDKRLIRWFHNIRQYMSYKIDRNAPCRQKMLDGTTLTMAALSQVDG